MSSAPCSPKRRGVSAAPWRDRADALPVACSLSRVRDHHELRTAVAQRQQQLDALPAGRGEDMVLFEPDPWLFVVTLLALWHRGQRVWLPGDNRPETRAMLAGRGIQWPDLPALPTSSTAPGAVSAPEWGALDPDHVAVVLFTSGSTGEPTPLPKCFRQLDSELEALARCRPLGPGCVINQVSHQHIYGLTSALLRPLCEQRPFGLEPAHWPESIAHLLDGLTISALISSPAQLSRLPESLELRQHPHDIFSSGAPLSAQAARNAERLLAGPVTEIYGSSETGGIAHRRQAEQTSWTPLADVAIDLRDGRLWLRSPRLAEPRQWYCHADRVAPAEAGRFKLLGRADRIAKVGGKRVSLVAMGQHLEALPGICRAHCLVIEHAGGRVGALVELDPAMQPVEHHGRRALIARLRNQLSDAFEATVLPRFWRFVPHWPVNAQGKLTHATLTRLFGDLDDRCRVRWLGSHYETSRHCRITLEVPERLTHLEGHFPGHPVVPGVVQLDWVIEQAGDVFAGCGPWLRLERVKFPLVLLPGERVTLTLTLQPGDERLDFRLDSHRGCHASGRLRSAVDCVDGLA